MKTLLIVTAHALKAGQTLGPLLSLPAGDTHSGYQMEIQKISDWPEGEVLGVTIDYSKDGGKSWNFDAQVTFCGGVWKTRKGAVITTGYHHIAMGTLNPGQPHAKVLKTAVTDLFRLTAECLQDCSVAITLSGVT
jgi:hypothetical protein